MSAFQLIQCLRMMMEIVAIVLYDMRIYSTIQYCTVCSSKGSNTATNLLRMGELGKEVEQA